MPILVGKDIMEIPCFGLDKITTITDPPEKKSYQRMCVDFDIHSSEIRRLRTVDLMLSVRHWK